MKPIPLEKLLAFAVMLVLVNVLAAQNARVVSNLFPGKWSDSSIWFNGHRPLPGDQVYLTQAVTLDMDASCYALNTNGHPLTIANGVHLNITGNHKRTGKDSLTVFDFGQLSEDTLLSAGTHNRLTHYYFGKRNQNGISKITRSQVIADNLADTVANFFFDDSLRVKSMFYSVKGVNDSSFYKFTYVSDTIVMVTRFKVDWANSDYILRTVTALRRTDGIYSPLGVTQDDLSDWVNQQIIAVGNAMPQEIVMMGVCITVGAVVGAVAGPVVIAGVAVAEAVAAGITVGGVTGFAIWGFSNTANASEANDLPLPPPSKTSFNKLITDKPLLDSPKWFGMSSPLVITGRLTVKTTSIVNVAATVLSDGGASVTSRGICWNANSVAPPTTASSKLQVVAGTGPYSIDIDGLLPETVYKFRPFAINKNGISYGSVVTFKSMPDTDTLDAILQHGAWRSISGNVEEDELGEMVEQRSEDCGNALIYRDRLDSIAITFFSGGTGQYKELVYSQDFLYNTFSCTSGGVITSHEWHTADPFTWTFDRQKGSFIVTWPDTNGGIDEQYEFVIAKFENGELLFEVYDLLDDNYHAATFLLY